MMVDTSFASISVPFLCCLQFVGIGVYYVFFSFDLYAPWGTEPSVALCVYTCCRLWCSACAGSNMTWKLSTSAKSKRVQTRFVSKISISIDEHSTVRVF